MNHQGHYLLNSGGIQFKITKQTGLLLFMMLFHSAGHTCAISPFYQIVTEPDRYIEKSDTIFYGRVVKIYDAGDTVQIAEFKVIHLFKGDMHSNIRIVNEIKSNCSTKFNAVGEYYYVFGNLTKPGNEIIMRGFPAFVPQHYADKMNLPDKLHSIH